MDLLMLKLGTHNC